jgi:hypothetical protein
MEKIENFLTLGTTSEELKPIAGLVKSAKQSVVFIEPIATTELLKYAAMRAKGVTATIYSPHITQNFKDAVASHNKQHPSLELKAMRDAKNRLILIDDKVYISGIYFNTAKKQTAFNILHAFTPAEIIKKFQKPEKTYTHST